MVPMFQKSWFWHQWQRGVLDSFKKFNFDISNKGRLGQFQKRWFWHQWQRVPRTVKKVLKSQTRRNSKRKFVSNSRRARRITPGSNNHFQAFICTWNDPEGRALGTVCAETERDVERRFFMWEQVLVGQPWKAFFLHHILTGGEKWVLVQ